MLKRHPSRIGKFLENQREDLHHEIRRGVKCLWTEDINQLLPVAIMLRWDQLEIFKT
jgi:hypothetical protein